MHLLQVCNNSQAEVAPSARACHRQQQLERKIATVSNVGRCPSASAAIARQRQGPEDIGFGVLSFEERRMRPSRWRLGRRRRWRCSTAPPPPAPLAQLRSQHDAPPVPPPVRTPTAQLALRQNFQPFSLFCGKCLSEFDLLGPSLSILGYFVSRRVPMVPPDPQWPFDEAAFPQ